MNENNMGNQENHGGHSGCCHGPHGMMSGVGDGCWGGKHFSVIRIVLGIFILSFVFSMGIKFGELKNFAESTYGSYMMRGYGPGMMRGWYNNQSTTNQPVIPSTTQQ